MAIILLFTINKDNKKVVQREGKTIVLCKGFH